MEGSRMYYFPSLMLRTRRKVGRKGVGGAGFKKKGLLRMSEA